jgi:hypothetical protein
MAMNSPLIGPPNPNQAKQPLNPNNSPLLPPKPSPLVGATPGSTPAPVTASSTPVVTAATPGPSDQYAAYRNAINQIVYSKGRYAEGQSSGNQGLSDWAANNAKQYYDQLPPELAAKLHPMGLEDAKSFYSGLFAGPVTNPDPNLNVPTDQSAVVNPYDSAINDLMKQLTDKVNAPDTNPFDAKLSTLIDQLTQLMNAPAVDPRSTSQYAAAEASINQQAHDNVRQAQESLGGSGLARSSIVTDRAQQIGNDAKSQLETQVIPAIAQQLAADKQQKIQNEFGLVDATGKQQDLYDTRGQLKIDNLNKLLTGEVSLSQMFETKQQDKINNKIATDTLDLQKQKFTWDKAQASIDNAHKDFADAVTRLSTLGYVTGADAQILGVPAGTPSYQASDAIANREFQFKQQQDQIAATAANVDKQIADSKLSREESKQARLDAAKQAKISDLIHIFESTRKAPPGLEDYGIKAGDALADTPSQALDKLKLDDAMAKSAATKLDEDQAPLFQSSYGVDKNTAIAMIHTINNPSRDAAIADLNTHAADLKKMGIDPNTIMLAVNDKWSPPVNKEKPPKYPAVSGLLDARTGGGFLPSN